MVAVILDGTSRVSEALAVLLRSVNRESVVCHATRYHMKGLNIEQSMSCD